MLKATILPDRSILKMSGADARGFLQGLITNDVDKLDTKRALYAALLTPQGKIIADFFLAQAGEAIYLDCATSSAADLFSRLKRYRLRSTVVIEEMGNAYAVLASNDSAPQNMNVITCNQDPRLTSLGYRWIAPSKELESELALHSIEQEPREHYERHRIECAIPDSVRDLTPETFFPLDCNFEELHGVDFDKGCYVGQELTSRMKHRASSRRRILPVASNTMLPPLGTKLSSGGAEVGEMLGSFGRNGLAQIRLDRLGNSERATADETHIRIGRPPYELTLTAEKE